MALSLLFLFLTLSLSSAAIFPGCHVNFSCGHVSATYPFSGGLRPPHCGPPQFHLTCKNSNTTEFTHNSLTYRVNSLSQNSLSLSLSRSDLSLSPCPSLFVNTTLDPRFFTPFSYQNLTLFYYCNFTLVVKPQSFFTCPLNESLNGPLNESLNGSLNESVNGSVNVGAIFLLGPIPFDPVLLMIATCPVIVTVPMAEEVAREVAEKRSSLKEALNMGFEVKYRDPYEESCRECVGVGGRCGFDPGLEKFICICGDDRACNVGAIRRKRTSRQIMIGLLVAGAVAVCLIFVCFIFACKKRRNRTVTRSIDIGETKAENIPFTNLTNSHTTNTTSSTSLSHSVTSFPSSNHESGKSSSYFGVKVFNCVELEEATDNFNPSREIGDGGFGTVFYGRLGDGREVAVKRLYENNFKRVEQFINEIEILTGLSHINLVKLYGCTSRRSRELLLVYEYIPNGTVADHLHGEREKSESLSWPIRLNIALETAEALAYLHKNDIIHRDVKTANILLNNDFQVKVADFGLSRLFPTDVTHVSTAPQGTPGYVDPEYYQCYQLTEKSDVYSFGVVLVELISSKQAVDINRNRHDINLSNMAVNKIQNGELRELVDLSLGFETNGFVKKAITSVAEIAFRCLQNDRDMRPSMGEVLEGLKRIKNEELNDLKLETTDIVTGDEAVLLKNSNSPISPSSVIVDLSISSSTTPSTSS